MRWVAMLQALAAPWLLPRGRESAAALSDLEGAIARAFPDVATLLPAELVTWIESNAVQPLILDVREQSEWAVGHISGAIRLDPGVSRADALTRITMASPAGIAGHPVILYCAVGLRSARLAERLSHELRAAGALSVHNLAGGAFRWANEGRALVTASGGVGSAHPYSRRWRRFLISERQGLA